MNTIESMEKPKSEVVADVESFGDSMTSLQKKLDEVRAKYDLIKDDPSYENDAKALKDQIFNLTERLISTKN
jgi:peptidoglycan hydrolase CwlO-like protein